MKKLYFLLFLTCSFISNAQIINFTDANFKAKLLSASSSNYVASSAVPNASGFVSSYTAIDTNGDGEIQYTEAATITFLNVSSSSISDLTGIEAFVNLVNFNCGFNQIANLDATQFLNLKRLNCDTNLLTTLDVTVNPLLIYLSCGDNQLSNLNVTQNYNLTDLSCYSNQITNLDVSQNLNLVDLSCDENQLTNLDVTQNLNLVNLSCGVNQLTNLDVTQNQSLFYLSCGSNLLSSLNLSQNTSLQILYCFNNQLSTLDLTNNTQLVWLSFYTNQIGTIDLSQNTNLTVIGCANNFLTSIDVSQCTSLETFICRDNQITNLDVSNNTSLTRLDCYNNPLTTLDVTANIALTILDCKDIPSLEALFLKNNNTAAWTTLDFSNNPNLEFVCCDTDDLADVQQKIIDYGYTNCQVTNLNCTYPVVNEVVGIVRYDYWDFPNGCDPSDYRVPNVKLEVNDGTSTVITTANQVGSYYIPLGNGNYTITPVIENPDYYNVSPSNFSVDFPTNVSPFTQDICLTWNGLAYYDDLEVVIVPTTPARPGFEASYKVIVRNKGFDNTNGTLVFTYDDAVLTYVSSTPVFSSSTSNTLTRNFFSDSFTILEFDLVFNVNSPSDSPAVNIDDELHFTADVTHEWTDYYPADNTFTLDQTVVGSYDPNDKTCLQGETEEIDIVGEYVYYMIRFENTGTFAAEKVVVEDVIDTSKFNISTLIPLHASHSYYTKITGNVVEFVFDNINLDFNDPNNDGFIVFKIKLLPTLVVGDTFSNGANIYFDFNPPIVTNNYVTTIVSTLATSTFEKEGYVLYPNPTKDVLTISTNNQVEIQSVEIFNLLGQRVLEQKNATTTIDVSMLQNGTYFIKVHTTNGIATTKFVKE